ncbi:MAG: D-alanine--D-alanine ligase family protein [Patescibacteria group bacterium]
MNKIKVGLLYGGDSAEHDVSIMTADSIYENIDKDKFDVIKIFIDKSGNMDEGLLKNIDIAFLAVHGANVEDGKLQKFLEKKELKYTGPHIEASALNMDKIRMHQSFEKAGIPTVEFIGINQNDSTEKIEEQINRLGYPVFVKPNNAGSSLGITKVDKEEDLSTAVEEAKKYDDIIIIEKGIRNPKEYEVAVLGNDDLTISDPGEVLVNGQFYSYNKKYFDPFETTTKALGLSDQEKETIKKMVEKAYKTTGCVGYSRIDFLMDEERKIYINEINTLPGFTKISMFPKLMAAMGISYKELIAKIINLGLECRR